MYVTAGESRVLSRIFGLLSEDLSEHDVREAVGHDLLELSQADHYASFVWQEKSCRFDKAVFLNMDPNNLAAYDSYFQYHDPITFKLQARREATVGLQAIKGRIVIDLHCEATSEKQAMGHFCDGRASLVVGTHTHVPTADAQVLPGGTAYQTDAGACADYDSVIGNQKEEPLRRFTTDMA